MIDNGELLPSLYAADAVGGWNIGMRALSRAVLSRCEVPQGPLLELGCGGGAFCIELAESRPGELVVGLDLRSDALAFAQSRSSRVAWLQGDLLALPYSAGTFALIVALDVVDQQEIDAQRTLAAIGRLLLPGGVALLRVSAHAWLFGPHDVAFGTGRRYARNEFLDFVRRAGLNPLHVTYANTLFSPAVVVVRLLQRWGVLPFSQELYDEGALNRLLGLALRQEAAWLRYCALPWGTSLFVMAQKGISEP